MWVFVEDTSEDILKRYRQVTIKETGCQVVALTSHRSIHDSGSYKYFCFSNIFPKSKVERGETRNMIFSSPNEDLVEAIYKNIAETIAMGREFNIGTELYQISAAKLLRTSHSVGLVHLVLRNDSLNP